MIDFQNALNLVLKNTQQLNTEEIPIEKSVGRILKEDIYCRIEMPPFDKSAMDGYAVIAKDIKRVPARLKCTGVIQAGDNRREKIDRGECMKIMTGAPMPENSDSVIMIEHTRQDGLYVEMERKIAKGENVCYQGEDLKIGQKVLGKNTEISSSNIALLATVGRRFVKVTGKPKVAVLNTGAEIMQAGRKLVKNKIYNSNGPMLLALLESDGIKADFLGIARDEPAELRKAIKKGLKADMLLISGGVSMGDYDLVPQILKSVGVKIIFHKVRIKPGKPLLFGKKGNKVIFGIPGNPVSNFSTYIMFIRPAVYKMMGYDSYAARFEQGIIEKEFHQKIGRKHFVLAKIVKRDNSYRLIPLKSYGSADVLALSRADGFMVMEPDTAIVKKNSRIGFVTWKKI
jgi:molybdopterin molybdotransferase